MNSLELLSEEGSLAVLSIDSISTISFYKGQPPVTFIKERLAEIITLNPWLSGNLKKKSGKTVIEWTNEPLNIDRHFSLANWDITSANNYTIVCQRAVSTGGVVPKGLACRNSNKPLFRATILNNANANEFALLLSMCHTVGDGYTFFAIQNMFNCKSKPWKLKAERLESSAKKADQAVPDYNRLKKFPVAFDNFPRVFLNILVTTLKSKFNFKPKSHFVMRQLDQKWLDSQKKQYKSEDGIISNNDCVTSWFFKESNADFGLMAINMRNRVEGLSTEIAGNYERTVHYSFNDFADPTLIRASIKGPIFKRVSDGKFKSRNGSYSVALITNWASFYKDVHLNGCELVSHMPILKNAFVPMAFAILFSKKEGSLAIITNVNVEQGPFIA